MEKIVLISNHIISSQHSLPIKGAIFVNKEVIEKLQVFDTEIPIESLRKTYSDYSLFDYSDYYISPGIIELNARREWESYSTFTKAAISGGITFILEEPGYYNIPSSDEDYFCDIGSLKVISNETCLANESGPLAYKIYLFPPSGFIKQFTSFEKLPFFLSNSQVPLFIDPNLPEARMHFLSSPLHYESPDIHAFNLVHSKSNIFAAAYGENVESGSSSEEDQQKLGETNSLINFSDIEDEEIKSFEHSKGGDELITSSPSNERNELSPSRFRMKRHLHLQTHSTTIYDDLNHRIHEEKKNFENLCTAETVSYKFSGSTSFSMIQDNNFNGLLDSPVPVSPLSPEIRSINRKRPSSISTVISDEDRNHEYTFFLANCPEHWETKGIDKILALIPTNSKVHIQNISSATSINQVREASLVYKNVTCEVSASHLFFSANSIKKNDTRFKSIPPIRNSANLNLLWDIVKIRGINSITSHHSCIDKKHKVLDSGNFQNALNGICSLGMSLQAIWTALNIPVTKNEKLEAYLVRISKWLSEKPAKILGIENRGGICEGKLADLIVWNPFCKEKVTLCKEYQDVSPYSELELNGKILCVFLRGKIVYTQGFFVKTGKRI